MGWLLIRLSVRRSSLLAELRVRASKTQAGELVAAAERVLNVQPKLASRAAAAGRRHQ
jgi:hypothetical protein